MIVKLLDKVCVENMRGGIGKVYLEKAPQPLVDMKMYARITIPSGCSIGVHTHVEDEEAVYVLEGNGVVVVDGKEYPLSSGDYDVTHKGCNHSIKNNSFNDLIILAVVNE